MYTKEFIADDELYHHGILGQKWGVRRYQNEDGTLTSAGKARRNSSNSKVSEDYKSAHNIKDTSTLSDKELRQAVNRLQMEQQYDDLKQKSSTVAKGTTYVATAASILGTVITLYNNSDRIVKIGKSFLDKLSKK